MFSTFNSGNSQQYDLDSAIKKYSFPDTSKPIIQKQPPTRLLTPKVHEPFKDKSPQLYEQPLLSKYKPSYDFFTKDADSSLSNVPISFLTQTNISNVNTSNVPYYGPFFGSSLQQDMSGTSNPNAFRKNTSHHVSLYTGTNDFTFERKKDMPEIFFSPTESKETKVLKSSGKGAEATSMMDIDRDRFQMDITKKDDCFEQIHVGPSINTDSNVPASGGFQSYYRYIDHDKSRKYNYGVHMSGPLLKMDVPDFPKLPPPKTESMPQTYVKATKPRIFDGAIDLQHSNFYKASQNNSRINNIPNFDKILTNKKGAYQNDVGNKFISTSFITPYKTLDYEKHEHFTDTLYSNNNTLSQPMIKGQSQEHPFNSNVQEYTKKNNNTYAPIKIDTGMKSIVPSISDFDEKYERSKERHSGSSLLQTVNAPKSPFEINDLNTSSLKQKKSYVSKLDTLNSELVRSLINPNLSQNPEYNNYNPNVETEVRTLKHIVLPKTAEYIKTTVHDDLKKTKRVSYESDKSQIPIMNIKNQAGTIERIEYNIETTPIETGYGENNFLRYIAPKPVLNTVPVQNLRSTNRNTDMVINSKDIGMKKNIKTGGQTFDTIKSFTIMPSLKKEQKIMPLSSNKFNTHINSPMMNTTNLNLRNIKSVINNDFHRQPLFIPSKSFPYKDYGKMSCRRHSDMDIMIRSGNPHTSNPLPNSARLNIKTRDKHNDKPNVYKPQPYLYIGKDISHFGDQSNNRI